MLKLAAEEEEEAHDQEQSYKLEPGTSNVIPILHHLPFPPDCNPSTPVRIALYTSRGFRLLRTSRLGRRF